MSDNEDTDAKKKVDKQKKVKAKVLDDVEDAEIESDKKKELDEEEAPELYEDEVEEVVGSDYEEEESDDELPEEAKKLSSKPITEDLQDSNYYRKITVVPDNMRLTSDIMTMFEFSEIIGIRTLQIEKGSPVFTDVSELHTPYDMAIKELFDRQCPLKVIRKTGPFEQEEYRCNEMGFPADVRSAF
jgi:DNA-directed RNA polymerase subunit K/omega